MMIVSHYTAPNYTRPGKLREPTQAPWVVYTVQYMKKGHNSIERNGTNKASL